MPKPTTAPARLNLLLPWLNGAFDEHVWGPNRTYGHPVYDAGEGPEDFAVKTDYPAIRRALADFVESFDGSAEAVYLEVVDDPNPPHVRQTFKPPTDEELDDLAARLHILLEQGFDGPAGGATVKFKGGEFTTLPATTFLPAVSLRFAVRSAGRRKPATRDSERGNRVVAGGVNALRDYRAAGAYVLQAMGPMLELVPFLVAHLLTAPNMVSVKRCERQGCTRFVITATAKRGRPQRFCGEGCRGLNRELEQQQVRKLIGEGRSNKYIADLLGIKVKTVVSLRKEEEQ